MKTEQIESNTTRVAVFFDGTGNNKTNSFNDPLRFGNFTNIAKLYDACEIGTRWYVEGVGTLDHKEDSSFAKATGNNPIGYSGYGYADKLKKGLAYYKDLRFNKPTEQLDFYIFGFSRGASLARDFAKEVLKDALVRVKYLGVIDTVVSLLTTSVSIFFDSKDMERIDQILHLCALNECRYYFPLTSITNTGSGNAPHYVPLENYYTDKVKEIYVPGAHADVGGGYVSDVENVFLNEIRGTQAYVLSYLNQIVKTVGYSFSCSAQQKVWDSLLGNNNVVLRPTFGEYNLVSERKRVKINMAFMYFEAVATIVNNYEGTPIFKFESVLEEQVLIELRDSIVHYVKSNVPVKGPCYHKADLVDYIHISANFGNAGSKVAQVNDWLNTFDPAALTTEVDQLKAKNPALNGNDTYDVAKLMKALGLPPLYVNAPCNPTWHREIHYEKA